MEFYLDEKQRKKKRLIFKLKIIAGVFVFLFLSGGIFYFVVFSQFFQITRISADSTQIYADSGALIQDLKNFFVNRSRITKFLGADNILVWSGEIEDFLKTQPVFSVLEIKKDYWKKEIIVKFAKREKFGIWCQLATNNQQLTTDNQQPITNNNCWWFDKDGVLFEKSPKAEGKMIYKINDNSDRFLNLADRALNEKFFKNLIKIFETLQESGLNIKILYLNDLALEEVEVKSTTDFIPEIYFSLRFDPDFSLAAIKSFKKIGLEKIQYIDFRVENRVYYKLK